MIITLTVATKTIRTADRPIMMLKLKQNITIINTENSKIVLSLLSFPTTGSFMVTLNTAVLFLQRIESCVDWYVPDFIRYYLRPTHAGMPSSK